MMTKPTFHSQSQFFSVDILCTIYHFYGDVLLKSSNLLESVFFRTWDPRVLFSHLKPFNSKMTKLSSVDFNY